ncbi:MAG: hypothetical protein WCX65_02605 [bacterium]
MKEHGKEVKRTQRQFSGARRIAGIAAIFAVMIFAAIQFSASAVEVANLDMPIGNAEIRSEKDAVFFRLRAPKNNRTEYGVFRYMRETGKWEPLGTVASFDGPIQHKNGLVSPEDFFYPRNGYQEIKLATLTYKIECINNKVAISVKGGSGPDEYYTTPEMKFYEGTRVFRFRYLTSSRLWFDMRIDGAKGTRSAGIGYFDLPAKTVKIITPAEIEPDHGKPIIVSEMSGIADNVWVGLAYCGEPTCRENGIVLRIGPDGKIARRWYSGEKGLPPGAVIRVMPDGDSLWIVTMKGIALIKSDKISRFQISQKADVVEGGKFGFKAESTPLGVTPEFAGPAVIQEVQGNHFRLKTKSAAALWVSEQENRSAYTDATATIKLKSGMTVAFRSAADSKLPAAKLTPGQRANVVLPVAKRQNGWIAAELPGFFWFAPDSVRLNIEAAGEFPADNFLSLTEETRKSK